MRADEPLSSAILLAMPHLARIQPLGFRAVRRHDRLTSILERLAEHGSVDVEALAGGLDVSSSTVRRDLSALEQRGLLDRTHGGAIGKGTAFELPLRVRGGQRREEKLRIARAAAAMVADGATIGLTGGTTTTEVARRLVDLDRITVVTNAINIAAELAIRPNLRLIVTGGVARPTSYELVGPLAVRGVEGLRVETAFIGVDGVSLEAGFTTHEDVEAQTNLALITRAARVVVVADWSKIGRVTLARICEVDQVDELVTDTAADPQVLAELRERGIRVTAV
jgi:DeoR family transcriptional regulator of aga operon